MLNGKYKTLHIQHAYHLCDEIKEWLLTSPLTIDFITLIFLNPNH